MDTVGQARTAGRAMGAILVAAGRLAPPHVDEIRRVATTHRIRFGEAGMQLNLLTPDDIEFALARQYHYPILPRGGAVGVSDAIVAAYDPHSPVVEGLRAIRSQLLLQPQPETGRQALAITSPARGEGRSAFAANLATLFAQMGSRTVLIDADLRHPHQHALFQLPNDAGLSAILTARAGLDSVQQVHPELKLFVLTAGLEPPNPQELLSRSTFKALLVRCAQQYDVVIVDTPAAAETADAQVIAARAGSALLIARRHHTRHDQLRTTSQCLTQTGVKIVGSVINEY